jgi:hypothetical protein
MELQTFIIVKQQNSQGIQIQRTEATSTMQPAAASEPWYGILRVSPYFQRGGVDNFSFSFSKITSVSTESHQQANTSLPGL